MNHWISIKEQLPPPGSAFELLCWEHSNVGWLPEIELRVLCAAGTQQFKDTPGYKETHWRALPNHQ
jgi:hypothetical protein